MSAEMQRLETPPGVITDSATPGRHRVAIVGCGFGGLFAARALRRAPVDITVIDRKNHHLFQPLLYQMATEILAEVPPGAQLTTSLNGGSIALMDVVEMAAWGRLKILVDRYPLGAAKQAYDDFEHRRLVGRAVLMPAPLEARAVNSSTESSGSRR